MAKKIKIIKSKVPDGIINQALALQSMQATEGWAIVQKNILDNIAYLEECILEKEQDGMPLNDLAVDRLRDVDPTQAQNLMDKMQGIGGPMPNPAPQPQ